MHRSSLGRLVLRIDAVDVRSGKTSRKEAECLRPKATRQSRVPSESRTATAASQREAVVKTYGKINASVKEEDGIILSSNSIPREWPQGAHKKTLQAAKFWQAHHILRARQAPFTHNIRTTEAAPVNRRAAPRVRRENLAEGSRAPEPISRFSNRDKFSIIFLNKL